MRNSRILVDYNRVTTEKIGLQSNYKREITIQLIPTGNQSIRIV